MANKTISDLLEKTTVADSDIIWVQNASTDNKVTKANLLKEVNDNLNLKANTTHTHTKSQITDFPLTVDNLTSTSSSSNLSANQGKILDDKITILNGKIGDSTSGLTKNVADNTANIAKNTSSLEEITQQIGDSTSGIIKDIADLKNNPIEGHIHENKTALDTITQDKIYKWDNAIGILVSPSGKEFLLKVKDDGTLYTEENILPVDFPTFTVVGESTLTNDFYITPHNDSTKGSYIFIMDYKGRVKWFKKIPNFAYSFRRYTSKSGKNRYTYHQVINDEFAKFAMNGGYDNTKLVVLDENYNLLEEVRCKSSGTVEANYPLENHDYIYIDDGHYIVTSYHNNTVTNVPSVPSCSVVNCVIQEIKDGQIILHWESIDHVELYSASHTNNSYSDFTSTTYNDYAHLNSVVIDERDNNLLLSFRHIGLVKINRTIGAIIWIMGRSRNDIISSTAPQCGYLQHDARYNYDNSITIFDNSGCASDNTRICRYWIDENTKTLTKFEEYIVPTITKTPFMGSATLIDDKLDIFDIAGYGSKGSNLAFHEYDFTNSIEKMKLKFDSNDDVYRIWRDISFNDVIKPDTKPPIEVTADGLLMYVDGRDGSNEEGTSIWADRTGNGHDVYLKNTTNLTADNGWNGTSLVTNGVDGSSIWGVVENSNFGIDFFKGNFTLEFSYSYESGSSDARLINFCTSKEGTSNAFNMLDIQLDKVRLNTKAPGGQIAYQLSSLSFNAIAKNNVIIKKDGEKVTVLINGAIVKEQESSWNAIESITNYNLFIDYEGGASFMNSKKSKVKWHYLRVYNKALSNAEIKVNTDYEETVTRK